MERDVLRAALGRLEGVELDGDGFRVAEGHGLTFYLGQPGQAMQVEEVEGGRLEPGHLELVQGPPKRATVVFGWNAVQGLRIAPPDERTERRAGFA